MKYEFHGLNSIVVQTTNPEFTVEISLTYRRDGRRGYYINVMPVKHEVLSGVKMCAIDVWRCSAMQILIAPRKSGKAEKRAVEIANSEIIQDYLRQHLLAVQSHYGFILREGF